MNDAIILYEDTENIYEKTFIGARLIGDSLEVLSKTVECDGIYSLGYYLDKENVDKLISLLGIERGDLISWIGIRFSGGEAQREFGEYCRSCGIYFKMYAS